MRIRARVVSAFGVLIAMIAMMAVMCLAFIERIQSRATVVHDDHLRVLAAATRTLDAWEDGVSANALRMRAAGLAPTDAATRARAARDSAESAWQEVATRLAARDGHAGTTAVDAALMDTRAATVAFLDALSAGDRVRADSAAGSVDIAVSRLRAPMTALIREEQDAATARFVEGHRTYRFVRGLILVGAPLMVLFCLVVALRTAHYLSQGVARVVEAIEAMRRQVIPIVRDGASAIARGALDNAVEVSPTRFDVRSRDEIGEIGEALNAVNDDLVGTAAAVERSRHAMRSTVAVAGTVIDAARGGDLAHRVPTDGLEGAYRDLAAGLNETLAAVAAPLQATADALRRVADRDLTARVRRDDPGEYHRLNSAINEAASQLGAALGEIERAVAQVSAAAADVAAGGQSLAEGSSAQAAAIDEAETHLQLLEDRARENADGAARAREVVGSARAEAAVGRTVMGELATSIDEMRDSADATARILRTIEDIAFRTNLLALNAAVEAARAGEELASQSLMMREMVQRFRVADRPDVDRAVISRSKSDGPRIRETRSPVMRRPTGSNPARPEAHKSSSVIP